MLSFVNLVEAHVLSAITCDYQGSFQDVRRAVTFLEQTAHPAHSLIERALGTNRRDLVVREAGNLMNISIEGQRTVENTLEMYLSRVEWDKEGFASRFYPFTGKVGLHAPKSVVMDPHLAFGCPVLAGTSIPTQVIAERFKAGESPQALAKDYGRNPVAILEAIRCELAIAA